MEPAASRPIAKKSLPRHAWAGDLKALKRLLAIEPKRVNEVDARSGLSALMYACILGHARMVTVLLGAEGIEVDLPQVSGEHATACTALFYACATSNLEIVRNLAEHGANVNHALTDGQDLSTPIQVALSQKRESTARCLLDLGAHPQVAGAPTQLQPEALAREQGMQGLADHLRGLIEKANDAAARVPGREPAANPPGEKLDELELISGIQTKIEALGFRGETELPESVHCAMFALFSMTVATCISGLYEEGSMSKLPTVLSTVYEAFGELAEFWFFDPVKMRCYAIGREARENFLSELGDVTLEIKQGRMDQLLDRIEKKRAEERGDQPIAPWNASSFLLTSPVEAWNAGDLTVKVHSDKLLEVPVVQIDGFPSKLVGHEFVRFSRADGLHYAVGFYKFHSGEGVFFVSELDSDGNRAWTKVRHILRAHLACST